jgi:hypothetical protein
MPVAGIMPQSDPNTAEAAAECDAMGWWLELVAGAVPPDDELQAAAASASALASAPVTMGPVLRLPFLVPDRMGFSLVPVVDRVT